MIPFIHGELPRWRKKARKPPEDKFDFIVSKLANIVEKKYVAPGYVSSLTDFFAVPKGSDDIRLVYNVTSCGLNQVTWAPNFWLPYPKSAIRSLSYNFYSADMDLGEMFLNTPLHSSMQEYSGIDLGPYREALKLNTKSSSWYQWTRTWMGARSSPYFAVRYYYLVEDFVRGIDWIKIIP
jgi:hypothetical protein